MTLLELIKKIKIDFSKGLISPDTGTTLNYDFDISPKEFLSYSKQDIKQNNKRGAINALTNAKRAIDCQTDKIFHSIGLDPNNFPTVIEEFILKSKNCPVKRDLPIKYKFLQTLNFAPAEIIANARNLRHKLEHFYKKPSDIDVSNAIELAELFILATDSKLKSMWDFTITDEQKHEESNEHLYNNIYIQYNSQKHLFTLTGYVGKKRLRVLTIKNDTVEYYYLLKIATSFDYEEDAQDAIIDLMEIIEHPIPSKNINIQVY